MARPAASAEATPVALSAPTAHAARGEADGGAVPAGPRVAGARGTQADAAAPPGGEAEPVQLLWERPLPGVVELALSPDGAALAALSSVPSPDLVGPAPPAATPSVRLRVYARDGGLRWERWIEESSRVVLGRDGALIATYEPDSALFRTLRLWDGRGRLEGTWQLGGPLASVVIDESGERVAAGTRDGEVIPFQREGDGWRRRSSWRVAAPVHYLAFAPQGSLWVVAGIPPLLGRYDAAGRPLWQARLWEEGARSVGFCASADGQLAAVAAETERPRGAEAQLWSAPGRRLCKVRLDGRAPCARPAGGGLIVAYERRLPRRDRAHFQVERVLAAFDATGAQRWWKGGAYFAPLLVAVETRGEWILTLGPQYKFWLRGRDGEVRWRSAKQPPVQVAVGSRDGRCAAAYCLDGRLMMLSLGN
jgi:hypothetical protein